MRRGKHLDSLEGRDQDKLVVIDEEGLAWKYPIRTEEHVRSETIGNSKVHFGGVKTTHGGDLDLDGGKLMAKLIKDIGKVQFKDNESEDTRSFESSIDRERDSALPEETVMEAGGHCREGMMGLGQIGHRVGFQQETIRGMLVTM